MSYGFLDRDWIVSLTFPTPALCFGSTLSQFFPSPFMGLGLGLPLLPFSFQRVVRWIDGELADATTATIDTPPLLSSWITRILEFRKPVLINL